MFLHISIWNSSWNVFCCPLVNVHFLKSNSSGNNSSLFRLTDTEMIFIFLLGSGVWHIEVDLATTKHQMICSLSAIHCKCLCKFTLLGCSHFSCNEYLTYTTFYHNQIHLNVLSTDSLTHSLCNLIMAFCDPELWHVKDGMNYYRYMADFAIFSHYFLAFVLR